MNRFPGSLTSALIQQIPPDAFLNMIRSEALRNAELEVVVGYVGANHEKVFIHLNHSCHLKAYLESPNFQWQDLFYRPLGRETSLVDSAMMRLVRTLLNQEYLKN